MATTPGGIGNVTANQALLEMAMAYSRSRVVCTAARLGVADALAERECSVDDLAQVCRADRSSLYRLLRALASLGVATETGSGRFALTPFGEPLRKDAPNSVWPGVVLWADLIEDSWSYLTECVRTGQTAMQVMESQGITPRWSKDPDANAIFRAVMGTAPSEDYLPIVRAWDFSGSRVVADLGGGGGALLSAVMKSYPNLKGMLVDRQQSTEAAAPRFQAEGLAARCQFIAADLHESVPSGADVYLMKHVLHGCQNEVAIKILKNCRAVMHSDAVLLVVEFVLPDVVSHAVPKLEGLFMSDLNMMTVTGGKERSASEWKSVLGAAQLRMGRVVPVAAQDRSRPNAPVVEGVSIIEATLEPC
ncbi:MAG TPA: methyltransferase [Candidatus Acidoferrales bacterium]|nr:methyltransferase [Candidatus Acidoferrales bacterium]